MVKRNLSVWQSIITLPPGRRVVYAGFCHNHAACYDITRAATSQLCSHLHTCGYMSYFFLPQGLYQGLERADDEGSIRNLQSLQERE